MHEMATSLVNMMLLSSCIKPVILEKGYVSEVKMNTKLHCDGFSKEVFTVKSEIQCTHQCLRKRCNLLNYNVKSGKTENCEVLKKVEKCTEFSNQSDWKLMTFVMEVLYKVQLDLIISSYGKNDTGFSLRKAIKVNGIDTGVAGRGFNVVVISSDNGSILGAGNFDTHGRINESSSMIKFINSYPDGSVLCIAITKGAQRRLTQDAKDYLKLLGSVGASSVTRTSSLAMLTAKGSPKPVWFEEKYAAEGNGPSIIETSIRI